MPSRTLRPLTVFSSITGNPAVRLLFSPLPRILKKEKEKRAPARFNRIKRPYGKDDTWDK